MHLKPDLNRCTRYKIDFLCMFHSAVIKHKMNICTSIACFLMPYVVKYINSYFNCCTISQREPVEDLEMYSMDS